MMRLEQEDVHPVLYWDNPNIHPFMEYKARLDAMRTFAESENLPIVVAGEYGLRSFTKAVADQPEERCAHCYAVRLEAAARHASANGFDAFSTTLMISPYQNADLICEAGEKAAREFGVSFALYDFRPFFRAGQEKIRCMDLYMQKYCGCIYSEEDRYEAKKAKLQRGFSPNFRPHSARRSGRQRTADVGPREN